MPNYLKGISEYSRDELVLELRKRKDVEVFSVAVGEEAVLTIHNQHGDLRESADLGDNLIFISLR